MIWNQVRSDDPKLHWFFDMICTFLTVNPSNKYDKIIVIALIGIIGIKVIRNILTDPNSFSLAWKKTIMLHKLSAICIQFKCKKWWVNKVNQKIFGPCRSRSGQIHPHLPSTTLDCSSSNMHCAIYTDMTIKINKDVTRGGLRRNEQNPLQHLKHPMLDHRGVRFSGDNFPATCYIQERR